MQQSLEFTLQAFVENQEFTLADVPDFLSPRNKNFRQYIVGNIKYNRRAAEFWRYEFAKPEREQEERSGALVTRIQTLFGHELVSHIIGQRVTTINFAEIMAKHKILFIKLAASLAEDIKQFIGTILINELVHAVRQREDLPPRLRHQFCIFVDEFQNFASSEDFAVLFTEARKYGIATTIAHHERFGQFSDNRRLVGATDAAGNKVIFQPAPEDARGQAPEFAQQPPTRLERERLLVISQNPVEDILKGHASPEVMARAREYLLSLVERIEDQGKTLEHLRLKHQQAVDWQTLAQAIPRPSWRDLRLMLQYRDPWLLSMWNANSSMQQVTPATTRLDRELLQAFAGSETLRLVLRQLNHFLTALMEGRIRQDGEVYARFLLGLLRVFFPMSEPLALYISLAYGDPGRSQQISLAFAHRQGLFTPEVGRYITEAQERTRREQTLYLEKRQTEREREIARARQDLHDKSQDLRAYREKKAKERIFDFKGGIRGRPRRMLLIPMGVYEQFVWLTNYPELLSLTAPLTAGLPLLSAGEVQRLAQAFASQGDPESLERRFTRRETVASLLRFLATYPGAEATVALLVAAEEGRGVIGDRPRIYPDPDPYRNLCMRDFPQIPGVDPLELLRVLRRINACKRQAKRDFKAFVEKFAPHYGWKAGRSAGSLVRSLFSGRQPEPLVSAVIYVNRMTQPPSQQYFTNFHMPGHPSEMQIDDLIRGFEYRIFGSLETGWAIRESRFASMANWFKYNCAHFARCYPAAAAIWERYDELERAYLYARALDLALYGPTVADATFPQPRLTGAPEVVAALRKELDAFYHLRPLQTADERIVAQDRQLTDTDRRELARRSFSPPEWLPARVFTHAERIAVQQACQRELSGSGVLTVIADFRRLCGLLCQPENLMQVPSTQYREYEVPLRTEADMVNEMMRRLLNLPPHSAYVKLVRSTPGRQAVWKGRIETLQPQPVPVTPGDAGQLALRNAINQGFVKDRRAIEAQMRLRHARFQQMGQGVKSGQTGRGQTSAPLPRRAGPDRLPVPPTFDDAPPSKGSTPPPPRQGRRSQASAQAPRSATPPGSIAPALTLESVRFFAANPGAVLTNRRYHTRFGHASVRAIVLELRVQNTQRQRAQTHRIAYRCYGPKGNLLKSAQFEETITDKDERIVLLWGCGDEAHGAWQTGTYRVEVFLDGAAFATGRFTIGD